MNINKKTQHPSKKGGIWKTTNTLWETFLGAYTHATQIPWRIYGNRSHKLLCADYGSLKDNDSFDNMEVVKCTKKNGYWRIVVTD